VVALALVGVRTSGAHLHLCFDGQEPRSSLHLADSEATCHDRAVPQGSAHQDQDEDVDVDALGAVVAKKDVNTDSVYPIAVAVVVFSLSPPPVGVVDELTAPSLAPKRPYLFLPLLRGPPV
jgi:hypothetical protein